MSARGLNLLVFRDGRREVSGSAHKTSLAREIQSLRGHTFPNQILSALLQAGELECALADLGVPATRFEKITDGLADLLLDCAPAPNLQQLSAILGETEVPEQIEVSVPEGFAFYALHPLAYADVLTEFAALPPRVTVVGIRSIGTTLSAVTAAALRKVGIESTRMTVRPTGHPYNRRMEFSPAEADFVRREAAASGLFLVVDEGPGLSGSSFLSVAEGLVRAGVECERITLICSHKVDADGLCAENVASRWRQFRSVVVPSQARRPADAQVWIGGGQWRRYLLRDNSAWPSAWLNFERLKFLSGESQEPRFYKFAGFGRYGDEVLQREQTVADGGFGPSALTESDGFASYPFLDGRPMSASDLSESVMARLAAYCAFRERTFAVETADVAALLRMTEHNLHELRLDLPVKLRFERPIIPDGRMQPHEWLLTPQCQMLKTDSGNHGDDHFFPGATDIAWDLAGAIVEWQMDGRQIRVFLDMYQRASGDNAQRRIADYITAYTVFRCAYCMMAANAMQGLEERLRLEQSATAYHARLLELNFAQEDSRNPGRVWIDGAV